MENQILRIFVFPIKMTKKAYQLSAAFNTNIGIQSFSFWVPISEVKMEGDYMLAPKWLVRTIEKNVKERFELNQATIIVG